VLPVLRRHGTIVTYASEPRDPVIPVRALMTGNARLEFVLVYHLSESMLAHAVADITAALDEGALRPLPAYRFPLTAVAAAHDAVEHGAVGKVLVDIP
jgi:NADPH:quinone reductase